VEGRQGATGYAQLIGAIYGALTPSRYTARSISDREQAADIIRDYRAMITMSIYAIRRIGADYIK